MPSFHDRQYDVYVMLGDPSVAPAWSMPVWEKLSKVLSPLVEAAAGPATVRTTQMRQGASSPDKRGISFGKIGWNERGHKKWVHSNSTDDSLPLFMNAEVWAPSWTACERMSSPPDVYFAFQNEAAVSRPRQAYNPTFIIAAATDRGEVFQSMAKNCAHQVASILQALMKVHGNRPWARRHGGPEPSGWINDLLISGLFQPGIRHETAPTIQIFRGDWAEF